MSRKQASYSIHNYVQDATSTFDEKGFNEIDGLVLTQISNMNLENSGIDLYSGKSKSFAEIWKEMNTEGTKAHASYLSMSKDDRQLIEELAGSNRYKNLSVSNFVKDPAKGNIDGFPSVGKEQDMEQFAAVTITYEQNGEVYNYVSYRATDGTSDGWAEDLAMLYSMETQAQADSTAYMNLVAGMTEGHIVGGGHSKGGGDFEYAYLFCEDEVRERILKGYVYDSPGLSENVLARTKHYQDYLRITDGSYICPQDSIIGQVLHEGDNAKFVHSVEAGFNQHDPYSWEIDPKKDTFVEDEQTEFSKWLNGMLDTTVQNMSQEEKEAFFSFVSYFLYNSGGEGIDGLEDLFVKGWKNEDGSFNWNKIGEVWDVISGAWGNMSKEEKKNFLFSLGTIVAGLIYSGAKYGIEKLDEWVKEKLLDIKQKIKDAWTAAKNWLEEKRKQFAEFLENVYEAIKEGFEKVGSWVRKFTKGGAYASANPQISVDTDKLNAYAERLRDVNRRVFNVDRRIDKLYGKVGLLDLWNLMQADLLTGYSYRLVRCAGYLEDTARDFVNVEKELEKSLS